MPVTVTELDRWVYQERLVDFLPPRLVDCHTHIWRV